MPDVRLGQAAQLDAPGHLLAGQLCECGRERVAYRRIDVAIRPDDEDPTPREFAGEESQQEQRRLVRSVEVVEDEDERTGGRRVLQEARGVIEESEPRSLTLENRLRQVREALSELRNDLSHVGGPGPELRAQRFRRALLHVRAQRLNPRPVGRRAARLPAASDEHSGTANSRLRSEFFREAALADARLTHEQDEASLAGDGRLEASAQLREFRLATDEDSLRLVGRLEWLRLHFCLTEVDRGILLQDRLLELAQRPARLNAEFADEDPPALLIDLERFRLAPGAVEREHQLRAQMLAQRMLSDKPLDLGYQLGVPAQGEISIDAFLETDEAQLLEARDLESGKAVVGELAKRRATPERQRLVQQRRSGFRVDVLGLFAQHLEAIQVQLIVPYAQQIPGRFRLEASLAEHPS